MKRIYSHLTLIMLFLIGSSFSINNKSLKLSNHAFQIERSKDSNTIYYDINLEKDGTLNQEHPIKVYWIKYAEDGQKESLTWIQKHYAYGLKFTSITKTEAKFEFVSYGKRALIVKKNKHGKYVIYTKSKGKELELNKIFIKITGGTFWFPKIPEVKLYGKDALTHKEITETIKP